MKTQGDRAELLEPEEIRETLADMAEMLAPANRAADLFLGDDAKYGIMYAKMEEISDDDCILGGLIAQAFPFVLMSNILRCRPIDHLTTNAYLN